jgi:Tol biopolymer transport system component
MTAGVVDSIIGFEVEHIIDWIEGDFIRRKSTMSARAVIMTGSGWLLIVLAASGSMQAQEPKTSAIPKATSSKANTAQETPAQAVARLVEQLKRHPVQPKAAPDRVGLYLMDVTNGEVTLIADQPAPGLTQCGSSVWSHDGRRILFDATPGTQWSLTRLQAIDLGKVRPTVTDLGAGNCPTFSRDDDRIAFLSNADGVESGVWLMKADGSDRRLLGAYGRPKWSPAGRQLMVISFDVPRQVTLMDANPEKSGALQLADQKIHSNPSWAGEETIVAAIGPTEGDTIALIDVSEPPHAKVKEILWRRATGPNAKPSDPVYSATTGRCIFVGEDANGTKLYSVQQGKAEPAKPLGLAGYDPQITGLAYSPDGRYILYSAHGASPAGDALTPGGRASAKEDRTATGAASGRLQGKIYVTGRSEAEHGLSLITIDPKNSERCVVLGDCSSRARISPDGQRVAFQKDGALCVRGLDKAAELSRVVDLAGTTAGNPAAWSRDGKQLIISLGRHDEVRRCWIHTTLRITVDGSERKDLPIPTEDNVQDWSADGRWLLTASSRGAKLGWQLYVMRLDGTEQRRITEGGNPFYARFSPDGRQVVYSDNARGNQSGIWIVAVDGTNARRVLPVDRNKVSSACWSPDGKRIAVTQGAMNPRPQPGDDPQFVPVVVVDLDTGKQSKIVLPNLGQTDMPDWR